MFGNETQTNHVYTGAYITNQSTNGGVRQQCRLQIKKRGVFVKYWCPPPPPTPPPEYMWFKFYIAILNYYLFTFKS